MPATDWKFLLQYGWQVWELWANSIYLKTSYLYKFTTWGFSLDHMFENELIRKKLV